MEHHPLPIARPRRRSPRVPPFYPVPVRSAQPASSACPAGSQKGWTLERQAHFLGWLAETGSVSAACARVGMSRNSAYKLRKKPDAESFAAAWDAALGMPVRRVTIHDLYFLAHHGLVRPRFRGGKYIGSRQKPDNSALLRLMARLDAMAKRWGDEG